MGDRGGAAAVRTELDSVRARIDAVTRPWTHPVEITAVTKAFPSSVVEDAAHAGVAAIGENYAQELLAKASTIDALAPDVRPRVDFIGHLQSNKVRQLVALVDRWCTVDRGSLVEEISGRVEGAHVLVQVNSTGEQQKGGCSPDAVEGLIERCRTAGIAVDGLMTIGPTGRPSEAAAPGFRLVRSLVDELGLEVCSMGMSDDLEVAVAHGATNVRVGSALFGARPTRDAPVHPPSGPTG